MGLKKTLPGSKCLYVRSPAGGKDIKTFEREKVSLLNPLVSLEKDIKDIKDSTKCLLLFLPCRATPTSST